MTDKENLRQASITMLTGMTEAATDAMNKADAALKYSLANSGNPADDVRTYAATLRDLAETMCLMLEYPVKFKAAADALKEE